MRFPDQILNSDELYDTSFLFEEIGDDDILESQPVIEIDHVNYPKYSDYHYMEPSNAGENFEM